MRHQKERDHNRIRLASCLEDGRKRYPSQRVKSLIGSQLQMREEGKVLRCRSRTDSTERVPALEGILGPHRKQKNKHKIH